MDLGLSDRVYVVTGAHAGLGRACAEQLAAEGARLVLGGTDDKALSWVAESLGGPDRAIAISGDLTDPGLETCLVAAAIARYGRLDGAALAQPESRLDSLMTSDDGVWRLVFEETLLTPLRLMRTVARHVSHEGGSMLMLAPPRGSSAATPELSDTFVNAMSTIVSSAATELGPRNIRVNGILPGLLEPERKTGDPELEELHRSLGGLIPLQRFGELSELARTAVFLLSPAASYVTGSLARADGGLSVLRV